MEPASGEGGIRTPDAGITDVTVFETAAFNHSATSPGKSVPSTFNPFNAPYCRSTCFLHQGERRLYSENSASAVL
jgi:hypothetical protein